MPPFKKYPICAYIIIFTSRTEENRNEGAQNIKDPHFLKFGKLIRGNFVNNILAISFVLINYLINFGNKMKRGDILQYLCFINLFSLRKAYKEPRFLIYM